MVYVRKGPYVDVKYPKAPPAGAKHIDAEYLNGVEDYLVAQDTANNTYATKTGVADTYAPKAKYAVVAEHHLDAAYPRPDAAVVIWVGSVRPRNIRTVDQWHDVALRVTTNQLAGDTFAVPAASWTGAGTLRWNIGGTVYDANTPSHVWATDGPHQVWMLYPADPQSLTGTLYLQGNQLTGDLAQVSLPQSLTGTLYLQGNQLTGDLAQVSLPQSLTGSLLLHANQLTGDLAQVSLPQSLTGTLSLYSNQLTGDLAQVSLPQSLTGSLLLHANQLTGDLAQVSLPQSLTGTLYLYGNNLSGNFDASQVLKTNRIWLQDNTLTESEVDAAVASIYNNRAAFTSAGHSLSIGGTNAAPSGVYQASATPATGKEMIYALINGTGFLPWTITYTA